MWICDVSPCERLHADLEKLRLSSGSFRRQHLVTCRLADRWGGAWPFLTWFPGAAAAGASRTFAAITLRSDPTGASLRFMLTRFQELRISCWAPGADHPPLFSLVKEPKGNPISRWIPSLFICTMLITASKEDQSHLNYPQSSQPPEDSPQY